MSGGFLARGVFVQGVFVRGFLSGGFLSEVTGGFTQVRIGNLINQSAMSCAISIPPLLEDCSEQKTFKDVARRWLR